MHSSCKVTAATAELAREGMNWPTVLASVSSVRSIASASSIPVIALVMEPTSKRVPASALTNERHPDGNSSVKVDCRCGYPATSVARKPGKLKRQPPIPVDGGTSPPAPIRQSCSNRTALIIRYHGQFLTGIRRRLSRT